MPIYQSREAVAVFADPDALEAAVTALGIAGFDRAAISVLGAADKVRERIGRIYETVREIEDDPRVPRAAFISRGSRLEGAITATAAHLRTGSILGPTWLRLAPGLALGSVAGSRLAHHP